jgi:predicted ATP-dependent endonuclease of OLD family
MKKHHEIKKIGSGQSKYETLKDLIEKLVLERSESRKQKPKEFYSSILLIDEPEALLNPFRIKRMASLIKDAVKTNNLTVILVSHSPEFLSHFIYEKLAKLVITQKDYQSGKLKQPLCF